MTDLRNLTILALMGRLLAQIDKGDVVPPAEIKQAIAKGTVLELLLERFGDFPEFAPIHKAEFAMLQHELRSIMDAVDGREVSKLGVENSGLCLLLAYCIEMLVHRNIKEITG